MGLLGQLILLENYVFDFQTNACKPKTMFDALCDLVPFSQFLKREKHPWRNVTATLQISLAANLQPY